MVVHKKAYRKVIDQIKRTTFLCQKKKKSKKNQKSSLQLAPAALVLAARSVILWRIWHEPICVHTATTTDSLVKRPYTYEFRGKRFVLSSYLLGRKKEEDWSGASNSTAVRASFPSILICIRSSYPRESVVGNEWAAVHKNDCINVWSFLPVRACTAAQWGRQSPWLNHTNKFSRKKRKGTCFVPLYYNLIRLNQDVKEGKWMYKYSAPALVRIY